MNDDKARLAQVTKLLQGLPIQYAGSSKEPIVHLNLIDLTKAIDVAEGKTNPDEWVSVYCGKNFGHSAHHWSEYNEDHYRPADVPLRIPHYCDGEYDS